MLAMGCTLALSIPLGLLNAWIVQRQELARQQEQVEAVVALFGRQLSKAVWDFDEETVRHVLSGLNHFPALQAVEVVAADLNLTYSKPGTLAERSGPVQGHALRAPDGDLVIGELRLSLDPRSLHSQVWNDAGRLIGVLVIELLLAVLMFGLLRKSVTLPVLALSDHVQRMTPARLDEPAPEPQSRRTNELHGLAQGVTRLQHELRDQLAEQSRGRRCRIPGICERPDGHRAWGCGGRLGRRTDRHWPTQTRSQSSRLWFGRAACARGGAGCRAWIWQLLRLNLPQPRSGPHGGAIWPCVRLGCKHVHGATP